MSGCHLACELCLFCNGHFAQWWSWRLVNLLLECPWNTIWTAGIFSSCSLRWWSGKYRRPWQHGNFCGIPLWLYSTWRILVNQVHLFSSGDVRCNMFPLGPCFQVQLRTKILTMCSVTPMNKQGCVRLCWKIVFGLDLCCSYRRGVTEVSRFDARQTISRKPGQWKIQQSMCQKAFNLMQFNHKDVVTPEIMSSITIIL